MKNNIEYCTNLVGKILGMTPRCCGYRGKVTLVFMLQDLRIWQRE